MELKPPTTRPIISNKTFYKSQEEKFCAAVSDCPHKQLFYQLKEHFNYVVYPHHIYILMVIS
jgi:hypothetical protein